MEKNIRYIGTIVNRSVCHKHRKDVGEPCYNIVAERGELFPLIGVCGKRLIKAGFVGKINPLSLSQGGSRGHGSNPRTRQGRVPKSSMG